MARSKEKSKKKQMADSKERPKEAVIEESKDEQLLQPRDGEPPETKSRNTSDFMVTIDPAIVSAVLCHQVCKYSHKDFIIASQLLSHLEKSLFEDGAIVSTSSSMEDEKGFQSTFSSITRFNSFMDRSNTIERTINVKRKKDPFRSKKFSSNCERRRIVRLTMETLKYSHVLGRLIEMSDFFRVNPDLMTEGALIRVVLYDFLMRKLEKRTRQPEETLYKSCSSIENEIYKMLIKFAADYARLRIKERAIDINDFCGHGQKELDKIRNQMPTFMWVNQLLITVPQAMQKLVESGFRLEANAKSETPAPGCFRLDIHCSDVLVFNKEDVDRIEGTELYKAQSIFFGDKGQCLAITWLIKKSEVYHGISVINAVSIYVGLHIESLFTVKHSEKSSFKSWKGIRMVFAGPGSRFAEKESVNLQVAGSKNIIIQEDVSTLGRWMSSELVFFYSASSMSDVVDPLEFVLNFERVDSSLLFKYIDHPEVRIVPTNEKDIFRNNFECFKHALNIPSLIYLLFMSHSWKEYESTQIVMKALSIVNAKAAELKLGITYEKHSPVKGDFQKTKSMFIKDNTFRMIPSVEGNGAYICSIECTVAPNRSHDVAHPNDTKKTTHKKNVNKSNTAAYTQLLLNRRKASYEFSQSRKVSIRGHPSPQQQQSDDVSSGVEKKSPNIIDDNDIEIFVL